MDTKTAEATYNAHLWVTLVAYVEQMARLDRTAALEEHVLSVFAEACERARDKGLTVYKQPSDVLRPGVDASDRAFEEAHLRDASARLIRTTNGAATLDDVARITGRDWRELLAEATNTPRALVDEITGATAETLTKVAEAGA